jgi:hypothetical protein
VDACRADIGGTPCARLSSARGLSFVMRASSALSDAGSQSPTYRRTGMHTECMAAHQWMIGHSHARVVALAPTSTGRAAGVVCRAHTRYAWLLSRAAGRRVPRTHEVCMAAQHQTHTTVHTHKHTHTHIHAHTHTHRERERGREGGRDAHASPC